MKKYHILVVGAGPAGSSAALTAAREGLRVLMLERRSVVGMPVRCAEYIPAPLMGEIDLGRPFVVQAIHGMRTVLPGGKVKEMRAPGFTIRRDLFDQALAGRAGEAGAEIMLSTKVLSRNGEEVTVKGCDGRVSRIRADVIIGADGPQSTVGRWIGAQNQNLMAGVQVRVPLVREMQFTEIYFHKEIYGGYGWLFPKGHEANVGVGIKKTKAGVQSPIKVLEHFLARLAKEEKVRGKPCGSTAGWIPAEPLSKINDGNILLVGDAAGHTHPITGAGISQAVISGQMAGKCAARAILEGEQNILSEYGMEWRDLFEETQKRAFARRQMLEQNCDRL